VLLRTLLDSPGLRLRVLTGEEALDRRIQGAFITDLLDPRRYLSGGEIVLTGLMWRRTPEDSEAFVKALAQAGVAALAAGDAALGSVPPDLVDACRRHHLPLLEVPVEVSFAAVTERVTRSSSPGTGSARPADRRPLLTGGHADSAAGAAAAEPAADAVARAFAVARAEYGLAGWVMSPAGQLVLGPDPAPDARLLATLAAGYLGAAEFPATVAVHGTPFSLLRITSHPEHRLAGWFLAFAGDHATWDEDQRTAAAELTGLAAAQRARHEESQRLARQSADDLLRQVLAWRPDATGPAPGELATARSGCGLLSRQRLVAVAAALGGITQPEPVARALLAEMLPGAAVGVSGADVVALAPDPEAVLDRVRAAVGTLRAVAGGIDLTLGVSAPAGDAEAGPAGDSAAGWAVSTLSRAVDEARYARRLAGLRGTGARMVDSARIGSHELLLAMVPAEARRAFLARSLAPLLSYDGEHGTELLRTLEVFLGCSGSWTKAAGQMHAHVNTLRYRIRRIEELTGRDLGSLEDQVDLLLALRLRSSVFGEHGAFGKHGAFGDHGAAEEEGAHPAGAGGVQPGQLPVGE
jgi:hypothetical protein